MWECVAARGPSTGLPIPAAEDGFRAAHPPIRLAADAPPHRWAQGPGKVFAVAAEDLSTMKRRSIAAPGRRRINGHPDLAGPPSPDPGTRQSRPVGQAAGGPDGRDPQTLVVGTRPDVTLPGSCPRTGPGLTDGDERAHDGGRAVQLVTVGFPGGVTAKDAAPLHFLCVAPHPDDAELGMGGLLVVAAGAGLRTGVLDLSRGERASNGSPEERIGESAAASGILGLRWRGNLGLRDRGLAGDDARAALAGAVRLLRPFAVFIPHADDPHPDHCAAHRLAVEAIFDAGLRRGEVAPWAQEATAFRPQAVLQYFINGWQQAVLTVDVSRVYATKRAAVAAHESQFHLGGAADGVSTRLNAGAAMAQVESRDRFFGAQAGVAYAEGFIPLRPLGVGDVGLLMGVGPR